MEDIRRAFNYSQLGCQVIDSSTKIEELDIKRIIFDSTYEIGGKLVTYTDLEDPITYCNSRRVWNALIINKEYYQAHKQELDIIIGEIVQRVNSRDISVSDSALISEELIEGISNNQNINTISLGTKEEVYLLKEKDYQTLKNGNISKIETFGVSEELENNFDSIIKYNQKKQMVGSYSYESLVTNDSIFFLNSPLSQNDLENLKYLNEEAEVNIMFDSCKQVIEIMNRFKELNQQRKYVINITDKNDFNMYLFSHVNEIANFENITVSVSGEDFNLASYLKYEKRLIDMVIPAMNFSPFERYMFAYNIVKHFKEYKENKANKNSSRQLYELLDNEYMVCVGYSSLLSDLLDKLGIPNSYYSVVVATGLEDVDVNATVLPDYYDEEKKEEILMEQSGHARCKVHLIDSKYGIDGYYVVDPTWDNDMQDDLYNFCLMTNDEYLGIDRETFFDFNNHEELYFVHSLEEFYQKLNFLLDKNSNKKVFDYIKLFIEDLKSLDPIFYDELINKYPELNKRSLNNLSNDMIQDILLDIGNHIVNKTNNVVSGYTIMECVKFLYENAYGMSVEDSEVKLQETIKINRERQEEAFPKRYKLDKNGIELVVLNAINKFDLENEKSFKVS